jgi:hypothetical protein
LIDVSLTEFLDFTRKSGTARVSLVRELKHRPQYHPMRDYYKEVRDFIEGVHYEGTDLSSFPRLLGGISCPHKAEHFESVMAGYKRFLEKKSPSYFRPPRGKREIGDVRIKVNPELGFECEGTRYLVKLYFKSEPLSRQRTCVATHLMSTSLGSRVGPDAVMAVLDTRRGRLYAPAPTAAGLEDLLVSEAMALSYLWSKV